ncbi:hypothetical protein [Hymenobacter cellulosivorans]|uniref:DUF4402 domain-containing protein n=1 Tax=Hymenobacter cellulosivorans TaxID=2932249 RepID=A0ABY4FAA0_9BACT|nr:hypothetical protein [Hymenobacter cellulosivorans]UOQ53460.1 hypothetical protein MUN80_01565 [Hymenobacter cellulosivorans]
MLKPIKALALLGLVVSTMSCEDMAVKPAAVAALPTSAAIKDGEPIINPIPGTLQKPGFGVGMAFGRGSDCHGSGVCYVKVRVTFFNRMEYPIAGQGTGFFSAPAEVNPETHIGTMRIIFTTDQKNINATDEFALPEGGTVIELEKPGMLGDEYSQYTLLGGVYKTIHGDGSDQNPYGYVDVPVLCK